MLDSFYIVSGLIISIFLNCLIISGIKDKIKNSYFYSNNLKLTFLGTIFILLFFLNFALFAALAYFLAYKF